MSITICTLHTKGLVNKDKRHQVFKYLQDKKFDIIQLCKGFRDGVVPGHHNNLIVILH